MIDREKVIKGLEHCISEGDCRGCPYFKVILDSKIICPCREDALALLKEQEEKMEHLNNITLEYEKEVFRLQTLLKEHEAKQVVRKQCKKEEPSSSFDYLTCDPFKGAGW